MRENWKTCKNCLKKFKAKSASQKYCGLTCKGEFNGKIKKIQYEQLSKSVFTEIKKGVKSQEEISKILEIPIASVRKIIPFHIVNIQEWYDELKQKESKQKELQEIADKEQQEYIENYKKQKKTNPTLPKKL
ncbi:MAG: hypothetical protein HOB51_00985 [Thaumarchaeota archaeon]|jgi:hypothetical protein|nr:hypothetical protein [Nitrososphaerota archaeon]